MALSCIVMKIYLPVLAALMDARVGHEDSAARTPAPLVVKAIRRAKANSRDPMALIPANAGTVGLTMVFGVLLRLGVAVGILLPLRSDRCLQASRVNRLFCRTGWCLLPRRRGSGERTVDSSLPRAWPTSSCIAG